MATYVLIHGAASDSWYWHPLAAELRARGHDVVAADMPITDDSAGLSEYADAVVAGIGPGIVGTGTLVGHGGMVVAEALSAASELGGRAVLALRISERDPRERHRGVSHHSRAALSFAGGSYDVAWPYGCPIERAVPDGATDVDVSEWREACARLPLSHMGRGPDDDPWFFAASFAAGKLAKGLLT